MPDDALARGARRPLCPTCQRRVAGDKPLRPFCSMTCKLVDLGRWLDGVHRVPGPPLPAEPDADSDRVSADA